MAVHSTRNRCVYRKYWKVFSKMELPVSEMEGALKIMDSM